MSRNTSVSEIVHAAQASKWMIAGNKGPQDIHTSFALLKKLEHKHKDKPSQKKSPVAEKSNEIPKKCTHCGIPGHTILECNKLKAALAAAQQTQTQSLPPPPRPYNKGKGAKPKKGTAMIIFIVAVCLSDHCSALFGSRAFSFIVRFRWWRR